MRIDDPEWRLTRASARALGCSPQEFIELAIRTLAGVVVDTAGTPGETRVHRALRQLVAEARLVKQARAATEAAAGEGLPAGQGIALNCTHGRRPPCARPQKCTARSASEG